MDVDASIINMFYVFGNDVCIKNSALQNKAICWVNRNYD